MRSKCGEIKKVAHEAIAIYAKYPENIMFICRCENKDAVLVVNVLIIL